MPNKRSHAKRLLLVNPLIHDFAAYDFWARPLGLLTLAGLLTARFDQQLELQLLDCTDPLSPWLPPDRRPRRKLFGHGKFIRTPIARPALLPPIGRRYSRYGLPPEDLHRALCDLERPEAVLMTSMMTYWYPGIVETIALLKSHWPDVPLVLGGVYASLCPEHAQRVTGADIVIPGPAEQSLSLLAELLALKPTVLEKDPPKVGEALPAHELLAHSDATALATSLGCPLRCPYCGVHALQPQYQRHSLDRVERELRYIASLGLRDVALYDDAFLLDRPRALAILERMAVLPSPLRFHGASGLSCRAISPSLAQALHRAGFITLRLGLETADSAYGQKLGGKVSLHDLQRALEHLAAAGYRRADIGVYILVGLPEQRRQDVERSIEAVLALGAQPHLAEYSPIPQGPFFPTAQAASSWDLSEPLYHNPTLMPCGGSELTREAVEEIKRTLRARSPGEAS